MPQRKLTEVRGVERGRMLKDAGGRGKVKERGVEGWAQGAYFLQRGQGASLPLQEGVRQGEGDGRWKQQRVT